VEEEIGDTSAAAVAVQAERGYACPALPAADPNRDYFCYARMDPSLGLVESSWRSHPSDEFTILLYDDDFESYVNEDGCTRFGVKIDQLNQWAQTVQGQGSFGIASCQAEGESVCYVVCHTDADEPVLTFSMAGLDTVRVPPTTSPPIAGAMVSGGATAEAEGGSGVGGFDLRQVATYIAIGAGVMVVFAVIAWFVTAAGSDEDEEQAGGDLSQPLSSIRGDHSQPLSAAGTPSLYPRNAREQVIGESDSDSSDDDRGHKKSAAASFVD